MFIATLFTRAKGGNNPNVHQWIMKKQSVVYTYDGMSVSLKKGGNSDICYNMEET